MSGEIHSGVQDVTVSNDSKNKDDEDDKTNAVAEKVSINFSTSRVQEATIKRHAL